MLSSDYNSVAAVLTNDVYKRLLAPRASERNLVFTGRLITLIIGLLSLGIALIVMGNQGEGDLFQLMVKLFGVFLPPIAIPMLLGLITSRVSNAGGLAGLLLGIVMGLCAYTQAITLLSLLSLLLGIFAVTGTQSLSKQVSNKALFGSELLCFSISVLFGVCAYVFANMDDLSILRETQAITTLTVSFTIVGILAGSILCPDSKQRREEARAFVQRLGAAETEQDRAKPTVQTQVSPLPVIGQSIAFLGLLLTAVILFMETAGDKTMSLTVGSGMTVIGAVVWRMNSRNPKEERNNE